MRTVWKGTIGFGAFAIPVRAYSATTEQSTGLAQVHTTDGGRIRYRRVCEAEDVEVPATEIGKGYSAANGDVVVLTEDDLAALAPPTAHSIQIHGFVDPAGIDPLYFAKSYYLEPDADAVRPYVLFGEALRQAGRVAVVKVAIRQRETLGVLRARAEVLMLDTLRWPAEIRTPDFPFLHEDVDLRMSEVRAAADMIENLTGDFAPGRFADEYSAALADLVDARMEGREVLRPTEAVQDEQVARLLRALRESTRERGDTDRRRRPGKSSGAKSSDTRSSGMKSPGARSSGAKSRSPESRGPTPSRPKPSGAKPATAESTEAAEAMQAAEAAEPVEPTGSTGSPGESEKAVAEARAAAGKAARASRAAKKVADAAEAENAAEAGQQTPAGAARTRPRRAKSTR